MDITHLLLLFTALLGVLLLLVLIYVLTRPRAAVEVTPPPADELPKKHPQAVSFEAAEAVILDRTSSKTELTGAVDVIAKYYGKIYATTLTRYTRIIVTLCRHPQTDKQILLTLDRALQSQNPGLKHELELALQKGLSSR